MQEENQRTGSTLLGYVQKWSNDVSILITGDQEAHQNFTIQERILGYTPMKVFVLNNIKYFQDVYTSFDNFDQMLSDSIRPFSGLKLLLNPKLQKNILYRKADALDRDQGAMEKFIRIQSDKKLLLESQQRALKHISTLNTESGDISLI